MVGWAVAFEAFEIRAYITLFFLLVDRGVNEAELNALMGKLPRLTSPTLSPRFGVVCSCAGHC